MKEAAAAAEPVQSSFNVERWQPRQRPGSGPISGRLVKLEPFAVARHADDLFDAYGEDRAGVIWRYRDVGPFSDRAVFADYAGDRMTSRDPLFFAIFDRASDWALGVAAYMNITLEHGNIEVGNITFAPRLQRTRLATEAMYLMARCAFDELGYRRYEWKCDDANAPSKRAALRLGFMFEGVFRHHMVIKGRNRDTAWFSMTEREWPARRNAMEAWLDDGNFDEAGVQKTPLSELTGGDGERAPA